MRLLSPWTVFGASTAPQFQLMDTKWRNGDNIRDAVRHKVMCVAKNYPLRLCTNGRGTELSPSVHCWERNRDEETKLLTRGKISMQSDWNWWATDHNHAGWTSQVPWLTKSLAMCAPTKVATCRKSHRPGLKLGLSIEWTHIQVGLKMFKRGTGEFLYRFVRGCGSSRRRSWTKLLLGRHRHKAILMKVEADDTNSTYWSKTFTHDRTFAWEGTTSKFMVKAASTLATLDPKLFWILPFYDFVRSTLACDDWPCRDKKTSSSLPSNSRKCMFFFGKRLLSKSFNAKFMFTTKSCQNSNSMKHKICLSFYVPHSSSLVNPVGPLPLQFLPSALNCCLSKFVGDSIASLSPAHLTQLFHITFPTELKITRASCECVRWALFWDT